MEHLFVIIGNDGEGEPNVYYTPDGRPFKVTELSYTENGSLQTRATSGNAPTDWILSVEQIAINRILQER